MILPEKLSTFYCKLFCENLNFENLILSLFLPKSWPPILKLVSYCIKCFVFFSLYVKIVKIAICDD
jgi:hypothetical protein